MRACTTVGEFRHGSVLQHVIGILNDLIADKTADVMFVCRHEFVDKFASLFVDVAATLKTTVPITITIPITSTICRICFCN